MTTTSVKLPPELKARVASLARKTGRSAHSLIVEAVERHTAAAEKLEGFVQQAIDSDADVERTGEMYRAEDVHAWIEKLASGKRASRPKPWRR